VVREVLPNGLKGGIQPKHAILLADQLTLLNLVTRLEQMNVPGWGFHPLKGDRTGHYAVWVNKNWRVTFTFEGDDVVLVDYQDYH
jgi:proteic killer suppression protein